MLWIQLYQAKAGSGASTRDQTTTGNALNTAFVALHTHNTHVPGLRQALVLSQPFDHADLRVRDALEAASHVKTVRAGGRAEGGGEEERCKDIVIGAHATEFIKESKKNKKNDSEKIMFTSMPLLVVLTITKPWV